MQYCFTPLKPRLRVLAESPAILSFLILPYFLLRPTRNSKLTQHVEGLFELITDIVEEALQNFALWARWGHLYAVGEKQRCRIDNTWAVVDRQKNWRFTHFISVIVYSPTKLYITPVCIFFTEIPHLKCLALSSCVMSEGFNFYGSSFLKRARLQSDKCLYWRLKK